MWKKVAPIVAVAMALTIANNAWAGQLGFWAFDDGTGTTARDSSGNGNHGRLMNGPTWAAGKIGQAVQLDGVDDYVEVPHSPKLEPATGQATVSVWINAKRHTGPNNQQWQGILAKGGAPRLYNLYTQQNQTLHFSTGPSGAYIGSSSTGLVPLNEWAHIAVVVDNAHRYFINGQPAGTGGAGARVPTGTTANLTIGRTNEAQREFQGLIDEVRIYDVALTAEQVKELYNGNPPQWMMARDPKPADKAVGIQAPILEWTPGDGAVSHNIYVGISPDLTEADRVATAYPVAMYWHLPGFDSGVTYYWRVDEIAADGVTVTIGDVWSFIAMPTKAYAASPADGAANVRRDVQLSWLPAFEVVSHDVYFGSDPQEVATGEGDSFQGNQSETAFDPGVLNGSSTYYWRIDGVKADGAKLAGDVWSFSTMPMFAISDPNLVGWWKLDGEAGAFVTDASGHDNHGALRGNPKWVAGYDGGALDLDGVDDFVEVPHNDTLTVNKEAAVMAWINARALAAAYQGVIAKGNTYRSYSLYLQSAGTLHFSTGPNTGYIGSTSSGATVKAGEWTHVCVMVDDGVQKYFVNGQPAGSGGSGVVLPGLADTATVRIGTTQEDSRCFNGLIDDARIYNTALTLEQLKDAMQGDPLRARSPQPANEAEIDVRKAEILSWTAGRTASRHDVYFGQDPDAVAAAHPDSPEYQGSQADTSFSLAGLVEFGGGDYFWRIDEVEADGASVHKGLVWRFTIPSAYIVDDMESYTDEEGSRIYEAWLDGYATQLNGSTVGYIDAPFAETKIVHGGRQSMPLDYNNVHSPYYSEAELELNSDNWSLDGVDTLSLWFRGNAQRLAEPEPGRYVISSTSNDVWGASDNFRFYYARLSGDGSILVKVNAITDSTTTWAKAGVMIRESLDPASTYAFMFPTPDGKRAFQGRPTIAGNAVSVHSNAGAVTFPVWVKVERKGSQFTASYSQDGQTWTVQPVNENVDGGTNPQVIGMTGAVYIGLAVASNNAGVAPCFGDFSDVVTSGSVGGPWKIADVGLNAGNDLDELYVVLTDSSNKSATVVHPDPAAVALTDWTQWRIPLTSFKEITLSRARTLILGVGDRKATAPTGFGRLYIDDIRLIEE